MKTAKGFSLFALLIVIATLSSGCRFNVNGVKGSGVRKTQQREVSTFTGISTSGAFEIQVVSQKPQTLSIEGDDNILPLITTEVKGDVLNISASQGYSVDNPIVIKIAVQNLESVAVSGAGHINVVDLSNDNFELDIAGAPTISVAGVTKSLRIDADGATKIDAHNLSASAAEVEANGASHVELSARDKLDITINGPSVVSYDGDPEVNQTINGPGKVEKRESKGV